MEIKEQETTKKGEHINPCYFCKKKMIGMFFVENDEGRTYLQPDGTVLRLCGSKECWDKFVELKNKSISTSDNHPFFLNG